VIPARRLDPNPTPLAAQLDVFPDKIKGSFVRLSKTDQVPPARRREVVAGMTTIADAQADNWPNLALPARTMCAAVVVWCSAARKAAC